MELNVTGRTVVCCAALDEKKAVLPVECSMILPDYYPDVMKILRYTAEVSKMPVLSDESGETVSGNVNIEVNYVSEEGELCACGQLQPFSHSFGRDGGNVSAAEAEVVPGELACRAVNKRRIDLHGSLELTLRALETEERDFIAGAEGAGAVCQSRAEDITVITGEYCKSFTLEETGELGYGKPPFGRLLRSCASAAVTECHVIQDKIVTKGEVRVKLLWSPEKEGEEAAEGCVFSSFVFPVSRMIDAPGVLITDTCDAGFTADFPEITPTEDGKSVAIKVRIEAFARVYRTEQCSFVTDMFSSDYESDAAAGEMSVIGGVVPISQNVDLYEKMELPEGTENVEDLWTEVSPPVLKDGKLVLKAKLCMFARDAEGGVSYYEKPVEKEIDPPETGEIGFYNLCASVVSEEFSAGRGGTAELSATVLIDGTIYVLKRESVLTQCSVNTEAKPEKDPAAVIFYYAEKGEPLWDIAKRYRTPLLSIMKENSVQDGVLPASTMLIIPK